MQTEKPEVKKTKTQVVETTEAAKPKLTPVADPTAAILRAAKPKPKLERSEVTPAADQSEDVQALRRASLRQNPKRKIIFEDDE